MENIIKKWSKEWDKTTEGRKYYAQKQREYKLRKLEENPNYWKIEHKKRDKKKEAITKRTWARNNPKSVRNTLMKYYQKVGSIFGLTASQYEWALKSWSVSVRERDLQICVNCGSTEDLQAHHIIPKKERPDLALDLNNGITYCLPCHKETESWGDCSFH